MCANLSPQRQVLSVVTTVGAQLSYPLLTSCLNYPKLSHMCSKFGGKEVNSKDLTSTYPNLKII